MNEKPTPMKLHDPLTCAALTAILDRTGTLFNGNAPEELVTLCRQLERRLAAATALAEQHGKDCHTAQIKLRSARAAMKALRDAKGRHNTKLAYDGILQALSDTE